MGGSSYDVTVKNDADSTVMTVATGTVNVKLYGDLQIAGGDITATTVANAANVYSTTTGTTTLGGGAVNIGAAGSTTTIKGAFNVDQAATFDSTVGATGDVTTSGTFRPSGDTAAADAAAVGYTAAEGLILTGQGSSYDATVKSDADSTVMTVATGTVNVKLYGDLEIA